MTGFAEPRGGAGCAALQRSRGREHGAASLLAVAVIGLIVMVSTGTLLLVGAVEASHRARLAADLAALAGAASARADGSTAAGCSRAAAVAEANRADLTGCSFSGSDIEVTVTTRVHWGPGEATARAAAGPAPHAPQ